MHKHSAAGGAFLLVFTLTRGAIVRSRKKILSSLESAYRVEFERAEAAADEDRMSKLDFEFQRDQILAEVVLDVRDVLTSMQDAQETAGEPPKKSLLEKAQVFRKLTRLR